MKQHFNAIYLKRGKWYVAWIEEIPGVNTQGRTKKEAKENLKEALELIIETNRSLLRKEVGSVFQREPLEVMV